MYSKPCIVLCEIHTRLKFHTWTSIDARCRGWFKITHSHWVWSRRTWLHTCIYYRRQENKNIGVMDISPRDNMGSFSHTADNVRSVYQTWDMGWKQVLHTTDWLRGSGEILVWIKCKLIQIEVFCYHLIGNSHSLCTSKLLCMEYENLISVWKCHSNLQ